MSFELENPEIANIIQQYKGGEVGYGEAKANIMEQLAISISIGGGIDTGKLEEINNKAKELLLGKELQT